MSVRLVVFAPEVVLEAESAVEFAVARHAGGGVGKSLKENRSHTFFSILNSVLRPATYDESRLDSLAILIGPAVDAVTSASNEITL